MSILPQYTEINNINTICSVCNHDICVCVPPPYTPKKWSLSLNCKCNNYIIIIFITLLISMILLYLYYIRKNKG